MNASYTLEIVKIIDDAQSRSDAIDRLFKRYSALPLATRDQFVRALAAELMVARAMTASAPKCA